MKYIDQNNIVNACELPIWRWFNGSFSDYFIDVSGMKEDLDIQGNEYTYMLSK